MRPSDRFLSILGRNYTLPLQQADQTYLSQNFNSLCSHIIGTEASNSLFEYWLENCAYKNKATFLKLGYFAAFLAEEYDAESMPLDAEDFIELRDTLNEAAEEMDMDVLTNLMSELVSSGYI